MADVIYLEKFKKGLIDSNSELADMLKSNGADQELIDFVERKVAELMERINSYNIEEYGFPLSFPVGTPDENLKLIAEQIDNAMADLGTKFQKGLGDLSVQWLLTEIRAFQLERQLSDISE